MLYEISKSCFILINLKKKKNQLKDVKIMLNK